MPRARAWAYPWGSEGRTWGFALADGRIVDPPELSSVLGMMIEFDILVMVQSSATDSLQLIGGITDADTDLQHECAPHIDFPNAAEYADNPYFKVEADSTRFEMKIEGVPSMENPRTGKLTPLSVIAALRGLTSPMRIGT